MNPPHPQPPLLTPNCCEGRGRLACGKSQQAAQPNNNNNNHKLRAPSPLTYPPALPLRWEEGRQKEGEGHQRGLGPK